MKQAQIARVIQVLGDTLMQITAQDYAHVPMNVEKIYDDVAKVMQHVDSSIEQGAVHTLLGPMQHACSLFTPRFKVVESSNISQIGYIEDRSALYMLFSGPSIYAYDQVPQGVYEQLMKAESLGKFFAANIKKGGYAWTKIDV